MGRTGTGDRAARRRAGRPRATDHADHADRAPGAAGLVGGRTSRQKETGVADQRHDAAFVVGAVLGGLAGATYGLLRAPQSGERTRAQLAEYAHAVVYRVEAAADRFADTAARLGGESRRRVDGAVASVRGLAVRRSRTEVTSETRPPASPAAIGSTAAGTDQAAAGMDTGTVGTGRPAAPLDPNREWPTPGQAVAAAQAAEGMDIVVDGPRPTGMTGAVADQ